MSIIEQLNEVVIPEEKFDGVLDATNAWDIYQQFSDDVIILDIRTNEEKSFVGFIPDSIHIAWANGTAFTKNPRFIREVEQKVDKKQFLFLICRSGNRSSLAASALKTAGFEHVYNIKHGFEGELNNVQQRNQINGWKFAKLPWIQN
jgi:rhodanese-related sulfurtransferase